MSKISRSQQDLSEDLIDQIKILKSACLQFDKWEYYHAKTIATSLRKFCKHQGSNRAILHEIGYMNSKWFLDTRILKTNTVEQGKFFLTSTFLGDKFKLPIIPNLDWHINGNFDFSNWWKNQVVIEDIYHKKFSREKITLYIAEQDWGAHVDLTLDQDYHELSRGNSAWFMASNNWTDWYSISKDSIYATIRQIAYELLVSLWEPGFQDWTVAWKNDSGYIISMWWMSFS